MAYLVVVIAAIYFIKWYQKPQLVVEPFDIEYRRYLDSLGDKNFLCYNNRKELEQFMELHVLPYLPEEVDIIFLKGKEPVSDYPSTVVSALLHKLNDYDGFPHLVKLRNGQQFEISINNETYNCINQGKPVDALLWKIYEFFEVAGKAEYV